MAGLVLVPPTPAAATGQGPAHNANRCCQAWQAAWLVDYGVVPDSLNVTRSICTRLDCDRDGRVMASTAAERRFFFDRSPMYPQVRGFAGDSKRPPLRGGAVCWPS